MILAIGILTVLTLIVVFRTNAFLALIGAAIIVSFLTPGEFSEKINRVALAFGTTAGKIGIVIAMAVIIGRCLIESGAADRIVQMFIKIFGEKRCPVSLMPPGLTVYRPSILRRETTRPWETASRESDNTHPVDNALSCTRSDHRRHDTGRFRQSGTAVPECLPSGRLSTGAARSLPEERSEFSTGTGSWLPSFIESFSTSSTQLVRVFAADDWSGRFVSCDQLEFACGLSLN